MVIAGVLHCGGTCSSAINDTGSKEPVGKTGTGRVEGKSLGEGRESNTVSSCCKNSES